MFQHLVVNKVGTYLMLIRWDMWWSWWTPDVWTWPCLKREMSNYFCVSSHIISAHVSSINIMISSMIYSQRVVNSTGVFTCTVPVRTSSYPRCWNGDVAGRRSSRILSSAAIFFVLLANLLTEGSPSEGGGEDCRQQREAVILRDWTFPGASGSSSTQEPVIRKAVQCPTLTATRLQTRTSAIPFR